jgi:SNF2 family DNA or RNA helicase
MITNTIGHCIVSKANRQVLCPRTGQTANMFPSQHSLTHLDQEWLVVPHGIRETIMLRSLGYELPNPVLLYYDFGIKKPFAVQRRTLDLMTTAPRCYVLNSMGTGKTKTTLWAFDYLHGNSLCGKMLVVCTLSTMKFVWQAEAFDTLPTRKVAILHGTKKQRLERLAEDADIYVINHDGLKTIQAELSLRTDIDVLCLDELAVYRNNSDRSKAMRKFAERFKIVWGLTGRPMPNEPTDVWAQAKIVTPNTAPKFFRQAQEMLMNKINNYKWVPKPEALERAMRMLQPNVRFDLDSVVELPEVISRTIDVPMTTQQAKVYKTLATEFKADIAGGTVTAVNAAVAMGKLLQVSGGWVYANPVGSINVFDETQPMPRHQTLVDLIEENERKVIVYVPYRHAIDGLSEILTKASIEHCVVHGDISHRGDLFNIFQNTDKFKVLV